MASDNVVEMKAAPREPRVYHTVTVPHFGSGWMPAGYQDPDQQVAAEAADRRKWIAEMQQRLHAVVAMFETDDYSALDMMQVADGMCRMFDTIRLKKNEAGDQCKAEMRAAQRASTDTEFDQVEYDRLERRLAMLRKSWLKFNTAFECALLTRGDVHSYTNSQWGSYIPVAQMKTARAEKLRLQRQAIFAAELIGKDEKALQAAIRARLQYEAEHDGIDADDHQGASVDDVAKLKDRQHQQALAQLEPVVKRAPKKPRTPKMGPNLPASMRAHVD